MAVVRVLDVELEVRAAWMTYYVECHRVPEHDYDEREPFAWRRLQKRLREIREYEEYECR